MIDPLISWFTLPPDFVSTQCERYYILHWSAEFLSRQILSGGGIITHQEIPYKAIYHRDTYPEHVHFYESNPNKQFEISFRKSKFEETGYALIRQKYRA